MSRLQRLMDRANAALLAHPRIALPALALLYLFLQVPRLFLIGSADTLAFPLDSIVMGQKLIFDGLGLRAALGTMLITPVNSVFIYPPGLYVLSALLGSIKGLFILLLLVQLAVPLLTYRLIARFAPPLTAFLVAAIGAYHFVNAAWWQPDLIIQPIMLLALVLLTAAPVPTARAIVCAGLLTGLITIFKHNVGIFFAILAGSWLFLSRFRAAERPGGRIAAFALLAGLMAFAGYFALRLPHSEEVVYFLLPYVLFWGLFAIWLARESVAFDQKGFFADAALFTVTALALPLAMFAWFANTVGLERYFHSLFHMGLENVLVWDRGLMDVVSVSLSFADLAHGYRSLVMIVFYAIPFLAGLYAAVEMYRQSLTKPSAPTLAPVFRVAMLPVMAVFMLFPLEGPHILITKLSVFVLGAVYLLNRFRPRLLIATTLLTGLGLVPVLAYGAGNLWTQTHTPGTSGGPALQRMVGLPMTIPIARELDAQVAVLQRTLGRQSFYVVDSSDGALWSLTALMDSPSPPHHVVMLHGLLNPTIADAIKAEMRPYEYVIVNHEEYRRVLDGRGNGDAWLDAVYAHVHDNFTPIARYDAPPNLPRSLYGILSFDALRRAPRPEP